MSDDEKQEPAWRTILKSITIVAGTLTALFAAASTAMLLMANAVEHATLVCSSVGLLCPGVVTASQPVTSKVTPVNPGGNVTRTAVNRLTSRPSSPHSTTRAMGDVHWSFLDIVPELIATLAAATILSALSWLLSIGLRSVGIGGRWLGQMKVRGNIQYEDMVLSQVFGFVWGRLLATITTDGQPIVRVYRLFGQFRDSVFTGFYWSVDRTGSDRGIASLSVV